MPRLAFNRLEKKQHETMTKTKMHNRNDWGAWEKTSGIREVIKAFPVEKNLPVRAVSRDPDYFRGKNRWVDRVRRVPTYDAQDRR